MAMTLPSARAPSTHHWRWTTHLFWFKSVGGTNSYDVYMMGGPAAAIAETMEKLKGSGNSLLSSFGPSLDNFNAVQDPKTGGYSVLFNQNKK